MVATRNITDLASLTAPAPDDVLLIVDRLSATSSEAKQITWGNLSESIQDLVAALAVDSTTIDFTYNDANGQLSAAVVNNTSTQKSIYSKAGTDVGTRQRLNIIDGVSTSVTVADNNTLDRVDVTINNTGVTNAVNLQASGTSFNILSGVATQTNNSLHAQFRPLKLGSSKLTASLSDNNNSLTLDVDASNIDINQLSSNNPLSIDRGGTNSSNASGARTNLGAAASGSNSDITALSALSTAIAINQGGTGKTTAGDALFALGGLKVLENVGVSGQSLVASGSSSVSGEYRGRLKSIVEGSNKVSVVSPVQGNTVSIDVNANNILSSASQTVNFNGQRLSNIGAPLAATDAVNKEFAESIAQGLTVKESCRVASVSSFSGTYFNTVEVITSVDVNTDELTSNSHNFSNSDRVLVTSTGGSVPGGLASGTVYFVVNKTTNTFKLSTTLSGSPVNITDTGSGVIQVAHTKYLEATGNGAVAFDGVSLSVDDRVLLQDQVDQTQNGIYDVSVTGDASTRAILTRSNDFNASGDMKSGSFTFIQEGNSNANIAFVQVTQDPNLDVSNIVFTPFSTANIPDGVVSNSKLADMNTATIKGRAVGSSLGDPVDLTADQTVAIINTATSAIDSGTY